MKDFCGGVGLEEYFCFPGVEQAGRFSKLVDNELEGRFRVFHKGIITCKEVLQDQFIDRFGFYTEVTEVKERPVQSIPDVHSMFYV